MSYNGTKGGIGRYHCDATRSNPAAAPCISFGALRVDQAVGGEIVRLLKPLGVEAAVRAITDCEHQAGEKQRQLELALEQARFEAARARRQYDAVDPDNRLVASELERRWNAALAAVETLEKDLDAMVRQQPAALSAQERQCLLQLGADLEAAWHHPAATAAKRKRIIRAVVGDPADSGCEGSPDRNRTEALREAHCPDFERTPKHSRRNLERRTRRPSGSAYPSSAGTCDEVAARFFFFYWPSGVYPPNRTVVRALTVASRKISKRYRL